MNIDEIFKLKKNLKCSCVKENLKLIIGSEKQIYSFYCFIKCLMVSVCLHLYYYLRRHILSNVSENVSKRISAEVFFVMYEFNKTWSTH